MELRSLGVYVWEEVEDRGQKPVASRQKAEDREQKSEERWRKNGR